MTVYQFAPRQCELQHCGSRFTPTSHNHRFCSHACACMSQQKSQVERWQDKRAKQKTAVDDLRASKRNPTRTFTTLDMREVGDHRKLDCANYDACLDVAARCEWVGFECNGCDEGYEPKPFTALELIRLSNLASAIEMAPQEVEE